VPKFPAPRAFPTFLSAALCLVVVALWIRSYLPETLLWESQPGRLLVIAVPEGGAGIHEFRNKQRLDEYLGALRTPQPFATPPAEHRLLGFYYFAGDFRPPDRFYLVGIPYWFLLTVAAVPLVIQLRRHRLAARRHAAALCPTCGYDCRATPERCPECGTTAPLS
jgi:hypothetical protein